MRKPLKPIRKYTLIEYEDLTARLYKGGVGSYKYLSPRWGYKWGYKYNQTVYVYLTSRYPYGGWLEILHFKNTKRKEIIEALASFKETSRRYKKAIKEEGSG